VKVHLGEKLTLDGRIDRTPPGSVRYICLEQDRDPDRRQTRLIIPPDTRNTGPAAIRMPAEIGEVYPFRYVEIEPSADVDPDSLRQISVHYPFDEAAASFQSSDSVLNAVWELCKYSIKATSFCGVYVDGDRERIPYEADAYINQLGHYSVDREYALARYTHEYLLQHPTWPTEWHLHSVLMAWADYLYTGETRSLETFYDDLCVKTLIDLAREDGLISTVDGRCSKELAERLHLHSGNFFGQTLRDLVDWPPGSFTEGGVGERDGHEMRPINTVVNAFHYRALVLLSRIASVLGHTSDQCRFAQQADRVRSAVNRLLWDPVRGIYVDGEGSHHASLHSNLFASAWGLVPHARRDAVMAWIRSRGMACSVYGAQYLLEALYRNDESDYAFELLTARHDRSWFHMVKSGATITWEAWDHRYKNNLDWNHAWGAAPANIIPRFLMGIRPLKPGFAKAMIQPRPGPLEHAAMTLPTLPGAVTCRFDHRLGRSLVLDLEIPDRMTALVRLPRFDQDDGDVLVDGKRVAGEVSAGWVSLDGVGPGCHRFERKRA